MPESGVCDNCNVDGSIHEISTAEKSHKVVGVKIIDDQSKPVRKLCGTCLVALHRT
jgi:hypothetical protein